MSVNLVITCKQRRHFETILEICETFETFETISKLFRNRKWRYSSGESLAIRAFKTKQRGLGLINSQIAGKQQKQKAYRQLKATKFFIATWVPQQNMQFINKSSRNKCWMTNSKVSKQQITKFRLCLQLSHIYLLEVQTSNWPIWAHKCFWSIN